MFSAIIRSCFQNRQHQPSLLIKNRYPYAPRCQYGEKTREIKKIRWTICIFCYVYRNITNISPCDSKLYRLERCPKVLVFQTQCQLKVFAHRPTFQIYTCSCWFGRLKTRWILLPRSFVYCWKPQRQRCDAKMRWRRQVVHQIHRHF